MPGLSGYSSSNIYVMLMCHFIIDDNAFLNSCNNAEKTGHLTICFLVSTVMLHCKVITQHLLLMFIGMSYLHKHLITTDDTDKTVILNIHAKI